MVPTYVQCHCDRSHLWMNYLLSQLCLRASPGANNYVLTAWSFQMASETEWNLCHSNQHLQDILRDLTCLTFWLLVWQHAAIKQAGLQGSIALAPWQHGYGFAELSGNLDLVDASWLKCETRTSKPWRQPKIARPEAPWSLESKAACVHNHIVDCIFLHCIQHDRATSHHHYSNLAAVIFPTRRCHLHN